MRQVSQRAKVFLFLTQGLIDADKELGKLQDKKSKLETHLGKLKEGAAKPDYENKVPETVRQQNFEKVGLLQW